MSRKANWNAPRNRGWAARRWLGILSTLTLLAASQAPRTAAAQKRFEPPRPAKPAFHSEIGAERFLVPRAELSIPPGGVRTMEVHSADFFRARPPTSRVELRGVAPNSVSLRFGGEHSVSYDHELTRQTPRVKLTYLPPEPSSLPELASHRLEIRNNSKVPLRFLVDQGAIIAESPSAIRAQELERWTKALQSQPPAAPLSTRVEAAQRKFWAPELLEQTPKLRKFFRLPPSVASSETDEGLRRLEGESRALRGLTWTRLSHFQSVGFGTNDIRGRDSVLARFQEYHHLPKTDQLDEPTTQALEADLQLADTFAHF